MAKNTGWEDGCGRERSRRWAGVGLVGGEALGVTLSGGWCHSPRERMNSVWDRCREAIGEIVKLGRQMAAGDRGVGRVAQEGAQKGAASSVRGGRPGQNAGKMSDEKKTKAERTWAKPGSREQLFEDSIALGT